MIALTLLLAVSSLASPDPATPRARFCIGSTGSDLALGACSETTLTDVGVSVADVTRSWIWSNPARTTVAVGTVAPQEAKITVVDKPSVMLTLSGSAERGWPAAATITLKRNKDSWKFTLPGAQAVSLRGLVIPEGTYELRIGVPHQFPFERHAMKVDAGPLQLGRIELKPLPLLRGRFVDSESKPVPDVAVLGPDGATVATSDPTGFVREEARAAFPPRLLIRRAGYGHRTIEVTRKEADFDFGTVTLSQGATMTVDVDRNGYTGALTASLIRRGEHDAGHRTTFESLKVESSVSRIELRDLEAREYVLLLRGDGPLQVVTQEVRIQEHEDATIAVRLNPHTVKAFVHQVSQPIKSSEIGFTGANGEWSSSIKTDEYGKFQTETWYEDFVSIALVRPPASRYSTSRKIESADVEWDIDVPDRRIRGVVVDKATGNPVAVKYISMRWSTKEQHGGLRSVSVRDDGRFEVDLLDIGRYEFTASDPAYIAASARVELTAEDHEREVRLEMEHGHEVRVIVATADGTPVQGAVLIASRTGQDIIRTWVTAADGIATVIFSDEKPLPVWVVTPRNGFMPATVLPAAQSEPARIVLPPVATVTVHAHGDDNTPVPFVQVLFAVNGYFVPPDVRSALSSFGIRLQTGSDGAVLLPNFPLGEYDFFGWQTEEENVWVTKPSFLGPPTHAAVLAGQNSVAMRVKPKEKKSPGTQAPR